jgi:hypothetical protein
MKPLHWLAAAGIVLNLLLVGIVALELHDTNKKLDGVHDQLGTLSTKVDALPQTLVAQLGAVAFRFLPDLGTLRCELGLATCTATKPGVPVYTVPHP